MAIDFKRESEIFHTIIDTMLDTFQMPYSGKCCENDKVRSDFLSWEESYGEQSINGFYNDKGDLICQSTYGDSSHPAFDFFPEKRGGWTMLRGWCRIVFLTDESDYVLKIPANFLSGRSVDFNQNEFDTYQKAVEAGYEERFAKCYKLPDYRGIPMLLMERIDVDEDQNASICYQTIEAMYEEDGLEGEELDAAIDSFSYGDSDSVEVYLGTKYGDAFTDWCDEIGLRDVHSGNFGFRNSDYSQPVICDYASY